MTTYQPSPFTGYLTTHILIELTPSFIRTAFGHCISGHYENTLMVITILLSPHGLVQLNSTNTTDCSLQYNQVTAFLSYRSMLSPSSQCKLVEGSSDTGGLNFVHSTCCKDEAERMNKHTSGFYACLPNTTYIHTPQSELWLVRHGFRLATRSGSRKLQYEVVPVAITHYQWCLANSPRYYCWQSWEKVEKSPVEEYQQWQESKNMKVGGNQYSFVWL